MSFGASFLARPGDLLDDPASAWGERPWGTLSRRLDLAGGPYHLVGLAAGHDEALVSRFGPAQPPSEERPDERGEGVVGHLWHLDASAVRTPPFDGWSYTFDRAPSSDRLLLAGLGFAARLALDRRGAPTTVEVWTPHSQGDDFGCLAANVLRTVVAYRLLADGGLLVHSAGIVRPMHGARGHQVPKVDVFLGHSGAGKSTLSRRALDAGRRVLSDDMNALSVAEDGTLEVEKLPFTGELGRVPGPRERLPLGRLCKLEKGPSALRPLSRARALGFMLTCAPFVNDDPFRADRLLSVLDTITARHPLHVLRVSLDDSPWPLLDSSPDVLADGARDSTRAADSAT
ncbi:MAG: hypothetical protein AAGC60_26015 [Acidobacteriota bacterium]